MAAPSLDRLIRKEVSLGAVRQKLPPVTHIGVREIAPMLDVQTDDVIFAYIQGGYQDMLAPARAEDAEAELAQKDDTLGGVGRAAVVDWSLKDKYTASDVSRYRQDLFIQEQLQGINGADLSLQFTGQQIDGFQARLARDDNRRRRALDNRIEWLIMQALQTSGITYNDGKIAWTVNYGRPAGQTDQAPASGLYNTTTFDPIGDFMTVSDLMYDTYGVRPQRVLCSTRLLNTLWKSNRWLARFGLVFGGASTTTPVDPRYLVSQQWGRQAAIDALAQEVNMDLVVYDSVYQTRAIGSNTITNTRFLRDDTFIFLPTPGPNADFVNTSALGLGPIDDTEVGFAKTLTSPHPEGNWTPGFYEWEEEMRDPWMQVRGYGIKAFPVFPYMELTYTMKAL
jgi:hypothetical protein